MSLSLRICIPTLNRRDKLQVCLNSIFKGAKTDKVKVSIYFGNKEELEFFKKQLSNIPAVECNYLESYRVPDFWNARLDELKEDALLYITDDVEFYDDTIANIISEYKSRFPDTDGVMGITQANIPSSQAVESAFGVIGTKYANRFPDRQVWPVDYNAFFCDFELWLFAKKINKFFLSSKARLFHAHPAFTGEKPDETHTSIRRFLKTDKKTFETRKSKGYLWGENFHRLTV